jgi:pyruvate dehydrogenase E1 component beta subunit
VTSMNMVEALNSALQEEMARDAAVVVLGEDVGVDGGVFRVTDGLIGRFGPDRVLDTPLSESGFVGLAAGMALYGMRPVVELQFDGFVPPAFDQVFSHISRMRNRSQGRYGMPMVIRFPYGGGVRALEHHAESIETLFVHTPGLKVVVPSTPRDAKGLLSSAIRDPDPVIFTEPKRLYRAAREEVPDGPYTEPIGKARVVRQGDDLTLVGWGAMVPRMLRAAELVAGKGTSAEVIDLRTLKPYDEPTVHASVERTGRAVVVQEAPRTLGFASEVSARISERLMASLEAPVVRLTGFDVPFPYYKMEGWAMPDVDRIIKSMRTVLTW